MARLAEGDDGALGPLFDAIAPVVRRYLVRRMAVDRIDATLQKVMLGLHQGRSTYLPGADVMTWAFSFAQFLIKDDGASTSTLDDDVLDLLSAGLHAKQIAMVLDVSSAKVRASAEQHCQRIEVLLDAPPDNAGARPRASAPNPADLVGNVVDRYKVEEIIGSGGYGVVYRATRIDVGDEVAIKVMREMPDGDRLAVQRFKREAQLMNEIDEHPNIVRVLADGELPDGRPWYAMTLLRGRSVDVILGRAHAAGAPLEWPRVARLVRQLCGALGVVHRQDIVHGDVKPANCFVTDDGLETEALRLLDFGLAKRAAAPDARRSIAPAGGVDGTAQYVAPELLLGRVADRRADIYAVGVMMFEMLTGRTPFDADGHAALVVAKTVRPTPTLAERADGRKFPRGIEAIVRRALHQDPAQRFASVDALSEAIAALGPTGRRAAPLWSLCRGARVRLAATASMSALAASLVTAWVITDSNANATPIVPALTTAHIEATVGAARPQLDECRARQGGTDAPDHARLKVLGATGQVIGIVEIADAPATDCLRDVLHTLRFPRFEAGEAEIEADL